LEGNVQRQGNRVRINAQLIDTRTDAHLWAQTYDREVGYVLRFKVKSPRRSPINSGENVGGEKGCHQQSANKRLVANIFMCRRLHSNIRLR
jgi:hypothetical protein